MSHTSGHRPAAVRPAGVRRAQKLQTRQSLLDAGLRLLEHQNLSSLGLRELTREVGISPAAFYRHFPDMADLGVALVDEALGSLHTAIRAVMADSADSAELIERTVMITGAYVDGHRPHVRFIARERFGGVRPVREAIGAELRRFADEVAAGLARQPLSAGWPADDLRILAELYVDHTVMTATAFLEAAPGDTVRRARVAHAAGLRMRIISVGRTHWLDPEP
ncbi:transcriptional regulator, TetR family [Streptomyces sp. DvalAA-14]|uniref:TetR family transcriptional regulator n=1 Tax=unclassified Streptomyces TaxID=2593676 RepID=UPI00081B1A69|nr:MULTISPECIES: TetR family transcriptional regulator [unclassified Streptomyces]MYS19661.1 TetR family transcriptional regulator [Streptomyces sp. SID4948]SCD49956.1 transcriptional regulator, TetR family [Streptomyces sp. DvalAA-14]